MTMGARRETGDSGWPLHAGQRELLDHACRATARRDPAGFLLLAPPGWGKTRFALAWLARWQAWSRTTQGEVMAPAALRDGWASEAARLPAMPFQWGSHTQLRRAEARGGKGVSRCAPVVVDEAHHFRNAHTRGYRALLQHLAGRPRLLMTATPVWNREDDLLRLLELVLPEHLAQRQLDAVQSLLREWTCGHVDPTLLTADGWIAWGEGREGLTRSQDTAPQGSRCSASLHFRYCERRALPTPLRRSIYALAQTLTSDAAVPCRWVESAFVRQLLSSEEALSRSLRILDHYAGEVRAGRVGMGAGDRAQWRAGLPITSLGLAPLQPSLPIGWVDALELPPAADALESALADVRGAMKGADTFEELWAWVESNGWSSVPWIVEVAYRGTAESFALSLAARGRAVALLTGGSRRWRGHRRTLDQTLRAWRSHEAGVLVMTAVGAEGLNLQHASRMVIWDHPWSPAARTQTVGRIVRQGQRAREVVVAQGWPHESDRSCVLAVDTYLAKMSRRPRGQGRIAGRIARNPWHRVAEAREQAVHRRRLARALALGPASQPLEPPTARALPERWGHLIASGEEVPASAPR